jgi:light-regulated signal transduction histidine kinase (bacteriophytochrome)
MSDTTKIRSNNETDTKVELEIYRKLKPYIGHCLTMNHELNNPLSVILGYSEFLHNECEQLTDEQKKYLNSIIKSAEKIQKCVTELSEEKIVLSQEINIEEVTAFYKKEDKESD